MCDRTDQPNSRSVTAALETRCLQIGIVNRLAVLSISQIFEQNFVHVIGNGMHRSIDKHELATSGVGRAKRTVSEPAVAVGVGDVVATCVDPTKRIGTRREKCPSTVVNVPAFIPALIVALVQIAIPGVVLVCRNILLAGKNRVRCAVGDLCQLNDTKCMNHTRTPFDTRRSSESWRVKVRWLAP